MAGVLPTQDDPAYITPHPFSLIGAGFSALNDRTEPNVRSVLEADVQSDPGITALSDQLFAGIDPALGMVAGIIEALVRKILGIIPFIDADNPDSPTGQLLSVFDQYFTNVRHLLADIDFLSPDFDPSAAAQDFITLMLLPLNILLGANSPLSAGNLFGLIPTNLLGFLPASSVGEAQPNLISNPDFEGDEAIESSVYTLDLTQSFSTVGGSAKVIADGSGAKDLLSPDLIRVSTNQEISISAMVKWTGLVGTGTPIRVGITGYDAGGSAIIQPDMATHNLTPGTSGWIEMGGTYKITNPSVVSIRLRLTVSPTATAGTVWWDHVDLHKTNKIGLSLIADENGNGLPDILDQLTFGLDNILTQIPGFASLTDLLNLQDVLGGDFGSGIEAVIANISQFLTPTSALPGANIIGSIADDVIPGLLTTVGSIASGLLNIPFGNYSHSDANVALTHTAETLSTLSAQVAALQVQAGSGLTGGDDFERVASSAGADWTFDYTGSAGTMKVDGHNLYFDGSGFAVREVKGLFLPLTLATDYQLWSVTLNSAPETADAILFNLPPIIQGDPAYNDVLGRMNAARTDYIRFRVGHGMAYIDRIVGGIVTNLNNRPFPTPGPGSTLTLQCGQIGSNSRYFKGMVNGQTAVDIIEIGTASPVDSNHRRGGLGGYNAAWIGAARQSRMGSVKQFLGADQ
jgi:hypothetical protein